MSPEGASVLDTARYVSEVFQDYKRYSGVPQFFGRAAEIGPGDNHGVGLMLLSDGCEQVDLVDRFYSVRNLAFNRDVYRELANQCAALRARFDQETLSGNGEISQLRTHHGEAAAAETFFTRNGEFDLIVSRSVLEHLYDPCLAIRAMARSLSADGLMLHKVDLRDHGMFSDTFHELKFLEIPDFFYSLMTRNSGHPNRVLIHRYREILNEVLPGSKLLVTRLAGVGPVEPYQEYESIDSASRRTSIEFVRSVRHRFARSLRSVSDEDLSIAGFFIVGQRTS